MRRSKLRNKRPKALFGEVAAAGIQAAATLAAANIQARQMASSAKEQAKAQIQGAHMQAKSIEQTNQNNNNLQQESQQFIASENEANRQLQRDWQMNMQLAQGMLTSEDRRAESRIQVKKGGKVRRSNKGLRDASFPLRAGNLPFQVTDGGGVIPIGTTPEGYDLYEIIGNDHEHYHKTKGGKRKSGVGIKFGNGQIVEGEGNQNSSQGEYLLTTPDAGFFISKHSVNGFNPAEAVNAGMSPIAAYQLQEANKNGSSPVGRMYAKAGAYVQPVLATGYPVQDLNFDMIGPNTAYLMQRPSLKRGGRVSSSKALIAATLNIKPIMCTSEEGKLIAIGKKIGTKRAAMAVVEKYFETRDPNYNYLYISHGDDIESANIIKRLILEKDNTVTIHISQICPVIGCHSGPGTVALCHIAK